VARRAHPKRQERRPALSGSGAKNQAKNQDVTCNQRPNRRFSRSGAVLIHVSHDSGVISSFVHFFVAEDGRPLTNSFGWGNWTGLTATLIAVLLLATSSDVALRKLKARPWKWLQRLNYALFALVILHAFFYGALLRIRSPFTLLLILSAIAVFVGQAVGIWLWRRRYAGIAVTVP
jgi:hypothetical protein